jgi:hypothetical protein
MDYTKKMRDFTEELKNEYRQEFADEQRLADELFNLYIEAAQIIHQHQEPKLQRETWELVSRTFNDLYAGWSIIMQGMLTQGMPLLRDTIECANYIKLLEVDKEFRNEWREGKNFFLRDIRSRMKKKGISPPPQDQHYRIFSQYYAHPSRKSTVSHVTDWYPTGLEHRVVYHFGSVKHVARTRFLAEATLGLMLITIEFLWLEMFPIDKAQHLTWHNRFAVAMGQLLQFTAKSDQEWQRLLIKQATNIQKILKDQYEAMESEVREISGRWVSARELANGSGRDV